MASVEVTDLHSGTRLLARISELSVGGCYIDALTPFPEGTLVKLRIVRDQGAFESIGQSGVHPCEFWYGRCFHQPDGGAAVNTGRLDSRDREQASLANPTLDQTFGVFLA